MVREQGMHIIQIRIKHMWQSQRHRLAHSAARSRMLALAKQALSAVCALASRSPDARPKQIPKLPRSMGTARAACKNGLALALVAELEQFAQPMAQVFGLDQSQQFSCLHWIALALAELLQSLSATSSDMARNTHPTATTTNNRTNTTSKPTTTNKHELMPKRQRWQRCKGRS